MSQQDLTNHLERAWVARFNQREEECFREFSHVRALLPSLERQKGHAFDEALKGEDASLFVSGVCLEASLERWRGKLENAETLLHEVSERLHRQHQILPSVLLLQLGLNQSAKGDSQRAMEYFLEAASRAEGDFEALCAEINVFQCLDCLGLPQTGAERKVEALLAKCSERWDLSSFLVNFEELKIRHAFRHGQFSSIFQKPVTSIESQRDFLCLWIEQLPYHTFSRPQSSLELLRFRSTLFHRDYRLRSLYGMLHPEDETDIKPSEWADRVYLWVWRWLTHPSEMPLKQVISALSALQISRVKHRLSLEDRLLLRNALGWIALFDDSTHSLVQSVMATLFQKGTRPIPLLEFEHLIIQTWGSYQKGEDTQVQHYRRLLQADALFDSKEIFLASLIPGQVVTDGSVSPSLLGLKSRLETELKCVNKADRPLTINLSSYEVINEKRKKRVISEPLCAALELFRRKPRVRMEDFVFVVFGIVRYDPMTHNPRIYNLLARLKSTVSPFVQVKSKSGVLFAEGRWNEIAFLEENSELRSNLDWKTFLATSHSRRGNPEEKEMPTTQNTCAPKRIMRRQELETLLGKSRATVNRRLSEWQRQGWIKRRRKSRATEYELKEDFLERLKNGEVWI